jgi:hypothetical protein
MTDDQAALAFHPHSRESHPPSTNIRPDAHGIDTDSTASLGAATLSPYDPRRRYRLEGIGSDGTYMGCSETQQAGRL